MSARPRHRADLKFVEQVYRGEQSFIVKDPVTHKYFRFRPVETLVLQSFDGRTIGEIALALAQEGFRLSAGAIEGFARKLATMGLMERSLEERTSCDQLQGSGRFFGASAARSPRFQLARSSD